MHRYYCAHSLTLDAEVKLEGSEAHHLLHVMRGDIGQQVTLFNGHGAEFTCEIKDTTRRSVSLRVVQRVDIDRELDFDLTVGCALPKGDRQRFLLEKLVELGATRFVPLRTERTVVQPTEAVCQRLRKWVIEASKQCGRNHLMQVTPGSRLTDYLSADFVADRLVSRLIAHPVVEERSEVPNDGNLALAIGPEGGFTAEEIQLAKQHHWRPVSLGSRVLRIETAAIALTARVAVK